MSHPRLTSGLTALTLALLGCVGPTPSRRAPEISLERAPRRAPELPAGHIGTDHPTSLQAIAPDGRWLVLCQARRDTDRDGGIGVRYGYHGDSYGDRMEPYLVRGTGPGVRLDTFIGSDGAGRWVAYVRRGRLLLWDSHTDRRIDLTTRVPVSRDDNHPFGAHLAGSFDHAGTRFVYLRRGRNRGLRAVVHELATGDERPLDHGRGDLWRAAFDPGGAFVIARVIPPGQRLARRVSSLSDRRCRGPVMSYSVFGSTGAETRLLRVTGGPPMSVEGVLSVRGNSVLRRSPDGALRQRTDDEVTLLGPPTCGARLLGIGPRGDDLLVACQAEGDPAPIARFSPEGRRDVGLVAPHTERDVVGSYYTRIWSRWRDHGTDLLDFETGRVWRLGPERDVVAVEGDLTLLFGHPYAAREREPWFGVLDLRTGAQRALPVTVATYGARRRAGRWYVRQEPNTERSVVIDLSAGRVAGHVPGRALAVATDGRVLLARASRFAGRSAAWGPLRWVRPKP